MPRTVLTKADVCEQLQISKATLQRLVASGELRQFKIGSQCRFHQEDVDEYVEHQRRAPRAPRPAELAKLRQIHPDGCGYYPGMKVV